MKNYGNKKEKAGVARLHRRPYKGEIMIRKLQALRECIRKLPAIAKDEIEVKEEALRLIAELQKDLSIRRNMK